MNQSETVLRLSTNENCFGCSPLVLEAILNKYKDVYLYPEVNPIALKEKLAKKYSVNPDNIVVGAGSVRIIDGLIQTFVGREQEVLTFEKSFIAYGQLSIVNNRKCSFAPLTEFRCVPENLIPFINFNTSLIFIANPNNPTGTLITHSELENFMEKIPSDIIVAVDEAYAEYVTDASFPDTLALQKKYPNIIIIHSFSKIYGLAGMRIGYAIMEEKFAVRMNKGQIPFSLNYLAADAAIAAMDDENFIQKSSKENALQREYLFEELSKNYTTVATQANFVYLQFDSETEKHQVYGKLFAQGILICDMKIYGQEKSLRITVGDAEACKRIVACLT
ncbi:MAG: histidinol-phosphate transaminase [Bacteroidota bacterium]|nr:histidinol-phosphate transaminase [Bacteroidota bacterium]